MTEYCSSVWVHDVYLSMHQLMDIWVVCPLWLLSHSLLWSHVVCSGWPGPLWQSVKVQDSGKWCTRWSPWLLESGSRYNLEKSWRLNICTGRSLWIAVRNEEGKNKEFLCRNQVHLWNRWGWNNDFGTCARPWTAGFVETVGHVLFTVHSLHQRLAWCLAVTLCWTESGLERMTWCLERWFCWRTGWLPFI